MEKEKSRFVEEQFHQQFSENYNNISGYLITFVVGLLSVIAAYGYTVNNFLLCNKETVIEHFVLLILAYLLVVGLLLTVNYLTIQLGWAMRRDQFIVHCIRIEYYGSGKYEDSQLGPFPKGYNPLNKADDGDDNILVGVFKYLHKAVKWWMIFLSVATWAIALFKQCLSGGIRCENLSILIFWIVPLVAFSLFMWLQDYWLSEIKTRYENLQKVYKDKYSQSATSKSKN